MTTQGFPGLAQTQQTVATSPIRPQFWHTLVLSLLPVFTTRSVVLYAIMLMLPLHRQYLHIKITIPTIVLVATKTSQCTVTTSQNSNPKLC
ncbi:hypothetical protein BaRGS_00019739 [Batillaria attramentaria]|uniref:Uncharacterized protein n=1 Tax=Batillaria attramentaria TaxID=370345 RepID=A0ABD0KQ07_9CAEN